MLEGKQLKARVGGGGSRWNKIYRVLETWVPLPASRHVGETGTRMLSKIKGSALESRELV